jgi:hypothetical protein
MARKHEDAFKRGPAANALCELHAALILTAYGSVFYICKCEASVRDNERCFQVRGSIQIVDGHRTVKVRHQSIVILPVAHVKPREVKRSICARAGLPHAAPRGGVGCGRPWDDLIRRASLNRVCTVERVPGFVFVR